MYKIGLIGGHFTTTASVMEELLVQNKISESEMIFFGRKFESGRVSAEFDEISKFGIKFVNVWTVKFNRFLSAKNFLNLLLFPLTVLSCILILIRYRARVLVGFGGYVSLPLCLAGKLLFIKIIIHEGTVEAGAANKILNLIAKRTLISFESSRNCFKNAEFTGLPLRKKILEAEKESGNIPIVLISGGHMGSKAINKFVFPIVEQILKDHIVFHQTGVYDHGFALSLKNKLPANLKMRYFISQFFEGDEFASHLRNSSVLIARSGINTVSETIYFGIPSIFIPLPFAQKNEQMKNARLAASIGLSEIIEQKNLSSESLISAINRLEKTRSKNVDNAKFKIIFKEAASKIAEIIFNETK